MREEARFKQTVPTTTQSKVKGNITAKHVKYTYAAPLVATGWLVFFTSKILSEWITNYLGV